MSDYVKPSLGRGFAFEKHQQSTKESSGTAASVPYTTYLSPESVPFETTPSSRKNMMLKPANAIANPSGGTRWRQARRTAIVEILTDTSNVRDHTSVSSRRKSGRSIKATKTIHSASISTTDVNAGISASRGVVRVLHFTVASTQVTGGS
jgi:hypothetical protein